MEKKLSDIYSTVMEKIFEETRSINAYFYRISRTKHSSLMPIDNFRSYDDAFKKSDIVLEYEFDIDLFKSEMEEAKQADMYEYIDYVRPWFKCGYDLVNTREGFEGLSRHDSLIKYLEDFIQSRKRSD